MYVRSIYFIFLGRRWPLRGGHQLRSRLIVCQRRTGNWAVRCSALERTGNGIPRVLWLRPVSRSQKSKAVENLELISLSILSIEGRCACFFEWCSFRNPYHLVVPSDFLRFMNLFNITIKYNLACFNSQGSNLTFLVNITTYLSSIYKKIQNT